MKRFLLLLIVLSFLGSCQKDDIDNLAEVIYVRRNGADMPAHIYGNGSSRVFIIILHGGPGGSGLEYRDGVYSAMLEEKYAMVYWDQRGQGMSQGHYSEEIVTLAEMAKDVNALALVLRHKYGNNISLFLMGHSWGGMLGPATLITDDFQKEFNGWIDVDGAHSIKTLSNYVVPQAIDMGEKQINEGNSLDFWNEFVGYCKTIDTTSTISPEEGIKLNEYGAKSETYLTNDGYISEGSASLTGLSIFFGNNILTSTIAGGLTAGHLFDGKQNLYDVDLTSELHRIKIPTLIMWGKYDLVVPMELAHEAYDNIGSIKKDSVIFSHSGHSPMMNEPNRFVDELSNFVDLHR